MRTRPITKLRSRRNTAGSIMDAFYDLSMTFQIKKNVQVNFQSNASQPEDTIIINLVNIVNEELLLVIV